MGLVNTTTLAMLLKLVAQQKLPVEKFVTHRFALDEVIKAYETFGNAAETHALKVLLTR
jgi:alcohol dehydrogenase